MIRRPPTSTLFPYTPLSRPQRLQEARAAPADRQSRKDRGDRVLLVRLPALQRLPSADQRLGGQAPEGRGVQARARQLQPPADRKSTRLNSSHGYISYAVFCL